MNERGMRSALQYGLCFAAAVLLHASLFLIPGGSFAPRESGTERGVRLRVFRPAPVSSGTSRRATPIPLPEANRRIRQAPVPEETTARPYSRVGGNVDSGGAISPQAAAGGGPGGMGGEEGTGGTGLPLSEYGEYLAHLRSDSVQGWAKERARISSRGWKGRGAGPETGYGDGEGKGSRPGRGGESGDGGDGYLDPRIQMVVTSYPPTGIEDRYTRVAYPDLKFKRNEYTSGWWNVYIRFSTDSGGRIRKLDVLRPETDGDLERQFVDQVKREIATWRFDPVDAEIHVDVRFYVE